MMQRVFHNIAEHYASISDDIAKRCKDDHGQDYSDDENYIYDFGDGFVMFIDVGLHEYFANCGFVGEAEGVHHKCKEALEAFYAETKDFEDVKLYAKVAVDNPKSSVLIASLGFEQIYKIYECKKGS